jgi:hypothetical protein
MVTSRSHSRQTFQVPINLLMHSDVPIVLALIPFPRMCRICIPPAYQTMADVRLDLPLK